VPYHKINAINKTTQKTTHPTNSPIHPYSFFITITPPHLCIKLIRKMRAIIVILFFMSITSSFGQSIVNGKIIDEKGQPLVGVNIYIDGTYDGAISDTNGIFQFTTSESGLKTLIATYLSFENYKKTVEVSQMQNMTVKLKESVTTLDAVVITAGTFEAGEKARVSVLNSLDIVTTAGAAGDIIGALSTLPGTQTVGEDGRLFVRGGEANETQTYVDGIRVPQPYGPTPNNTPTRSRFSPFLFNGISFSTGGYSAEYGEALSSVLTLNTIAEPQQDQTDISLMTVGLGLGRTKKWDKQSISLNLSYINLGPYQKVVPQNFDWNKPVQAKGGEAVYRYKLKNGLLRFYTAYDNSTMDINQEDINTEKTSRFALSNNNIYSNLSYKGTLGEKWMMHTGLSYGQSTNKINIPEGNLDNDEDGIHAKVKMTRKISDRINIAGGMDYFYTDFQEKFKENQGNEFPLGYKNHLGALYTEGDIFLSKNLAFKVGARASRNSLLDEYHLDPRASMAYKLNDKSQVSLAYGDFTQSPNQEVIKFNTNINSEKASHYIVNYQYKTKGRLFRTEAYLKNYDNLIKFNSIRPEFTSSYNNNGNGYAKGLDIFWRDSKTFKYTDYWVSYSYIDSERNFRNFPSSATPSFIAKHNLSIVTKHFIKALTSQIGFSYTVNSGRPYNNPNEKTFMNGKTKSYQNLSFNWAYLISQQKILYFSISNITNNENIFGYQYANRPDTNGNYRSRPIGQAADRFIFLGFFWTISADKNKNQLDNL
jgi:outer membrane cobalamin receptor